MTKKRLIILIFIGLLCAGFLTLREMREGARRKSCMPKVLLIECQNYAKEHESLYPPLSPQFGRLIFDDNAIERSVYLREYFCEFDRDISWDMYDKISDTTPVNDWSYVYLGYFLENEAQGMAFIKAYRSIISQGGTFAEDLIIEDLQACHGQNVLYRLRKLDALPTEAACLKPLANSIPVFIEWPGNHRRGGHVVYLDGHQEFVEYPGKFPMTREFIKALLAIDAEIFLK
jgi:hypothetical protein